MWVLIGPSGLSGSWSTKCNSRLGTARDLQYALPQIAGAGPAIPRGGTDTLPYWKFGILDRSDGLHHAPCFDCGDCCFPLTFPHPCLFPVNSLSISAANLYIFHPQVLASLGALTFLALELLHIHPLVETDTTHQRTRNFSEKIAAILMPIAAVFSIGGLWIIDSTTHLWSGLGTSIVLIICIFAARYILKKRAEEANPTADHHPISLKFPIACIASILGQFSIAIAGSQATDYWTFQDSSGGYVVLALLHIFVATGLFALAVSFILKVKAEPESTPSGNPNTLSRLRPNDQTSLDEIRVGEEDEEDATAVGPNVEVHITASKGGRGREGTFLEE